MAPNTDNTQRGTERRIVAQILTCMDDLVRRMLLKLVGAGVWGGIKALGKYRDRRDL